MIKLSRCLGTAGVFLFIDQIVTQLLESVSNQHLAFGLPLNQYKTYKNKTITSLTTEIKGLLNTYMVLKELTKITH